MVLDAISITIIFIILSALVAVIVRKTKKDKCLKSFRDNIVTLELINGQTAKGELKVKSSGIKIDYSKKISDQSGLTFLSYLLYKSEYPDILAIVRYYKDLRENAKKEREKDFKKTFNPSRWRRVLRTIINFLKIIKDSIIEILNLLTNHLSKTTPVGMTMGKQENHITRMKNEVYGVIETSYEPLLEEYIGHRVILELKKGNEWVKYKGVLKEYTAEFIEIIDVEYGEKKYQADLIVLRKYGIVRNLSE